MLVELLAVIGGDDHDGAGPLLAHRRHQPPHGRIGVGDLAVVAIDVPAAEGELGVALVGLVGLEEVHPDERLPGLHLLVVGEDLVHAALGVEVLELDVLEVEVGLGVGLQLLRVDEEDRRRIEGGRAPAVGAQHGSDRLMLLARRQAGEGGEVFAGQHRRHGERRVRRLAVGAREARPLRRQRVQVRRGPPPVARSKRTPLAPFPSGAACR